MFEIDVSLKCSLNCKFGIEWIRFFIFYFIKNYFGSWYIFKHSSVILLFFLKKNSCSVGLSCLFQCCDQVFCSLTINPTTYFTFILYITDNAEIEHYTSCSLLLFVILANFHYFILRFYIQEEC